MGRRRCRARGPGRCAVPRGKSARHHQVPRPASLPRLRSADRKTLLLGTALASTLLLCTLLAPTPASAVACAQPASPNPINDTQPTFIICVNTEPRTDAVSAIQLMTNTNAGSFIDLYNSGILTSPAGNGIVTQTNTANSPITITNVAVINAYNGGVGAVTTNSASDSDILTENSANIGTTGNNGTALFASTSEFDSDITILNSGDLINVGISSYGILARAGGSNSSSRAFSCESESGGIPKACEC